MLPAEHELLTQLRDLTCFDCSGWASTARRTACCLLPAACCLRREDGRTGGHGMTRGLVLCGVVLGFTACTITWSKPGVTQEEYARDSYACEVDASRVAPTSNLNAINQGAKDRMLIACMESKGYRRQ